MQIEKVYLMVNSQKSKYAQSLLEAMFGRNQFGCGCELVWGIDASAGLVPNSMWQKVKEEEREISEERCLKTLSAILMLLLQYCNDRSALL